MQRLIPGVASENSPLQVKAAVYYTSLAEEKNFGGSLAISSNVDTFQQELVPRCDVESIAKLQGHAPQR